MKYRLLFFLLFSITFVYSPWVYGSLAGKPSSKIHKPRRISLDVKNVDIKDVARMFAQVSGINIIVGSDVKAKITLRISNVNWKQALDMILKTNHLSSIEEGKFLRIVTYRDQLQEERGIPLMNKVIPLNFLKSDDVVRVISSMRSPRGIITSDSQTNSVIITDIPSRIEKMTKVIGRLDKITPQVLIEALMVDVKLGSEDQLGINWSLAEKGHLDKDGNPERQIQQNLSTGRPEGIIKYGKALFPYTNFTALIDMWCEQRKAEVLANPRIMTLNGLTAKIELVEKVPYTSSTISTDTGAVTTTVSFKDAGIKLYVTPYVNEKGFVSLDINTEQSFVSGMIDNQPIIDSRKAETNLLAKDGETIVIGGLRKRDTLSTIDSIPLIGKIPIIGRFFQRKVSSTTNSELLIFVTPHIIIKPELSLYEKRQIDKFKELREANRDISYSRKAPFPLRSPEFQ